jgi:hypothetical protein
MVGIREGSSGATVGCWNPRGSFLSRIGCDDPVDAGAAGAGGATGGAGGIGAGGGASWTGTTGGGMTGAPAAGCGITGGVNCVSAGGM